MIFPNLFLEVRKMLFKNLRFKDESIDILIKNGRIAQIGKELNETGESLDCKGLLLSLPFNDPHIHIDSAFTAGQPKYNNSGTLFEGIEIWRVRKRFISKKDFLERTNTLFASYVKNGVQNIRAHLDVTAEGLEIFEWANEQKKIWENKINIQIVAFPQDGILTKDEYKDNLEKVIKIGIDVIGGIPHYEISTRHGWESIDFLLVKAKEHNLLIDMHCDEIDDPNSKFLEYLAARTYELGLAGKVTASHTTAFARYDNAYVRKLWRVLNLSQMNFIANPLVNVHLGGRFDQVDPGRGITRVKELIEQGLNVAYGHDDVQDPWYSLGSGNMMQVLFMGIHLNHLTGQDDINQSLDLISKNSAKLMNLNNFDLKIGSPANFIVLNASSAYEAIRDIATVNLNVKEGKIIYKSKP